MVYLIELAGCDEKRNLRFELKIGYTGDPEGKMRFGAYSSINSGFRLLATILDGDMNDEQKIHNYFKKYRLVGRGREYYDYSYHDIFIKFFKDHPDHRSLLSVPVYIPAVGYVISEHQSSYIDSNINKILISLSQVVSMDILLDKSFQTVLCRFMEIMREDHGREDNTWNDLIDFCSLYLGISGDKLLEFTEKFNSLSQSSDSQNENINAFLLCYSAYKTFEEKLKFLCEALRNNKISLDEVKTRIDPIHYNVIILYGIDKCRAVGYKRCNVENLLNNFMNKTPLSEEIYKTFEPGKRYTVKYIKETLGNIYIKVGVKMSAKATVLKDYFEVKEVLVTVDGKQQKGLLLLGRK